jgi:hypothetical protein
VVFRYCLGSGFCQQVGLQYAAPFTFLSLRFAFGIICPFPLLSGPGRVGRAAGARAVFCVAGLTMHGMNLGGSHYAQYLGLSAGIPR